MLSSNFPEHEWLPWKFRNDTRIFSDDVNKRKFLEWVGKELGYQDMNSWYSTKNEVK